MERALQYIYCSRHYSWAFNRSISTWYHHIQMLTSTKNFCHFRLECLDVIYWMQCYFCKRYSIFKSMKRVKKIANWYCCFGYIGHWIINEMCIVIFLRAINETHTKYTYIRIVLSKKKWITYQAINSWHKQFHFVTVNWFHLNWKYSNSIIERNWNGSVLLFATKYVILLQFVWE